MDALHASVRASLDSLAEAAPGEKHRLVSPLAEGSDRIVAEEASARGWELVSLLPFSREDYEKDFHSEESRLEFERLLAQATRVRALAGRRDSRSQRDSAYTAVGHLLLDVSDVLVAIWDGKGSHGEGGTAQVVREAAERGLVTVWIPSVPPHAPELLLPSGAPRLSPEKLADLVSRFPKTSTSR